MGFIFEIFLSNFINMIKNYSCRCKFWPACYVASTQRDSNMIIWISLFHLVLPIHEITTLYMIASAQYTQSTTLLCSLSLPRHVRFRNSNRYYFTPPFIQLFSKTKKNKHLKSAYMVIIYLNRKETALHFKISLETRCDSYHFEK